MHKNKTDVLVLAVGKWPSILMHFGVDEKAVSGKHAPCPICTGTDRFRMIQRDGQGRWICNQCGSGDGMDLLMAVLHLSFADAAERLKPVVGGCHYVPPQTISKQDRRKRMKRNVDLWGQGVENHPLLREYLEWRGLTPNDFDRADLRLVEQLAYFDDDGKQGADLPAMVARVSSRDGKLSLIHRTYLARMQDGVFRTKKKMTSPAREWKGGAARLFDSRGSTTLLVTEGIETALSFRALFHRRTGKWVPAWAALNADALANLAIPEHIERVIIGADNDGNFTGQKAAYILANRVVVHDHKKAAVAIPRELGYDFNDELRSEANEH